MSLEDVPRCQHLKLNGTQCGSPALRRKRRCYFHEAIRFEQKRIAADTSTKCCFELPLLEDANAVQLSLMRVIQWLASGQMEPKIAGLMLYALQTASCNLRNVSFEAEKPTDVVIDRDTLDQTCINGPQWFASDFAEQKEAEESNAIAASAHQATAEAGSTDAASEQSAVQADRNPPRRESRQARRARARAEKRKRPRRAEIEQPPSIVRDLLYKLCPDAAEARVGPG
jgi:hypothetical protein